MSGGGGDGGWRGEQCATDTPSERHVAGQISTIVVLPLAPLGNVNVNGTSKEAASATKRRSTLESMRDMFESISTGLSDTFNSFMGMVQSLFTPKSQAPGMSKSLVPYQAPNILEISP